ncbi:MAG: hypothetical protein RLZZ337_311 [Bacteroidota bacterium]|jgi:hypothetical protein
MGKQIMRRHANTLPVVLGKCVLYTSASAQEQHKTTRTKREIKVKSVIGFEF